MTTTHSLYNEYCRIVKQAADIKNASAVLQWDQETYLPPYGDELRGQQIATLNELAHNICTSEKLGEILTVLQGKNDLSATQLRNVTLSAYDYNRQKKIPSPFVREMTESINKSYHAWIAARKANNFTLFEQPLQQVIEMKRKEADLLGYDNHPYDALMNDFDRGLTVSKTDALFAILKPAISNLLSKIQVLPQVDDSFLYRYFPHHVQWEYGIQLLKKLHFNFNKGRQDVSEHPFTTSFGTNDVRLTTRIDEYDFCNMTWSCIHELGHGLYEQGLPNDQYGLPLGECCSLSIHESQSRLWENCIGRNLHFWEGEYSNLLNYFPEQLDKINVNDFYKAINKVMPSLIRTEADELTYHFHIMIRYELEKQLIEGSLHAKDIPDCWNELYKQYLGVIVPDHKSGCLQDVHWSHGSFGYFATYSIGSLYAAQFFASIKRENPDLESNLRTGNTTLVWNWLQQHIYNFGRYYSSEELCKQATGETLNTSYFINYVQNKYTEIYVP